MATYYCLWTTYITTYITAFVPNTHSGHSCSYFMSFELCRIFVIEHSLVLDQFEHWPKSFLHSNSQHSFQQGVQMDYLMLRNAGWNPWIKSWEVTMQMTHTVNYVWKYSHIKYYFVFFSIKCKIRMLVLLLKFLSWCECEWKNVYGTSLGIL